MITFTLPETLRTQMALKTIDGLGLDISVDYEKRTVSIQSNEGTILVRHILASYAVSIVSVKGGKRVERVGD